MVHRTRTHEACTLPFANGSSGWCGAAWAEGSTGSRLEGRRTLSPQTLKKIMGWTRRDLSRYGFGPASWRLDMVIEMIRPETGRFARPRTLRRILRHCSSCSYSKPRTVPRKTAPAEEQWHVQGKGKKDDSGRGPGHGYRGAGSRRGRRHARDIARIRVAPGQCSRDEVRTGFLHQGSPGCSGRLDETGST